MLKPIKSSFFPFSFFQTTETCSKVPGNTVTSRDGSLPPCSCPVLCPLPHHSTCLGCDVKSGHHRESKALLKRSKKGDKTQLCKEAAALPRGEGSREVAAGRQGWDGSCGLSSPKCQALLPTDAASSWAAWSWVLFLATDKAVLPNFQWQIERVEPLQGHLAVCVSSPSQQGIDQR